MSGFPKRLVREISLIMENAAELFNWFPVSQSFMIFLYGEGTYQNPRLMMAMVLSRFIFGI